MWKLIHVAEMPAGMKLIGEGKKKKKHLRLTKN
jgi:hypothetical protein